MIDKQYGKYRVVCDFCEEPAKEEFNTFDDAAKYKRENGRHTSKEDGAWIDVCPECWD